MKKRLVIFLQYLIWLTEGRAWAYYKRQIDVFIRFGIPRQISLIKRRYGLVKQYSFNVINIATTYDSTDILNQAIEEDKEDLRVKNQKKARFSVERYAKRWKNKGVGDIEHMEALDPNIKLNREEKAHASLLEVR